MPVKRRRAVSVWCAHLERGRSLAEFAAERGISLRCAYHWLAGYRSGGAGSLAD